jgi:DNA-binding Lrp family transcriptional regulator
VDILDTIDLDIIKSLIEDCRISYQELSKRTGITRSAVKKRLDRLVESNVIHDFVVRLSSAMSNMEYAFTILKFESTPNEENLYEELSQSPSIYQVSKTFDGRYCVFAVYFSIDELSELTTFLWNIKDLKDIRLYPKLMVDRGGTMKFTGVHLRILRCLMKDARMSISNIARDTSLTTRKVTKALKQMRESGAVRFTIRVTENVGEKGTEVVTAVGWDTKQISLDEVMQWLKHEFRDNFIAGDPLATEPTILVEFTVNHVRDVDTLSARLRKSEFINSVDSMILYPSHRFSDSRAKKLDDYLTGAGF